MRANKNEYRTYKHLRFIDKAKGKLPNKSIKESFAALVFAMERFPRKATMDIETMDYSNKKPGNGPLAKGEILLNPKIKTNA
ncbi:MAG: hypothetical protein QM482_08820 [Sulfurospirillum sp.]